MFPREDGVGGERNVTGKLPIAMVVEQGRATYIRPSYHVLYLLLHRPQTPTAAQR
jgi:hypothetical protein